MEELQLIRLPVRDLSIYYREHAKARAFMDQPHPNLWKAILIGDLFREQANVDELGKSLTVFTFAEFVEMYRQFQASILMGFDNPYRDQLLDVPSESFRYLIGISLKDRDDTRFFWNYPPVNWENQIAFLYTGPYAIKDKSITFGAIEFDRATLEDEIAEEAHRVAESQEVFIEDDSVIVTVRISLVLMLQDDSFFVFYDDRFDLDVGRQKLYNSEEGVLFFPGGGRAEYSNVETTIGDDCVSGFHIIHVPVREDAVKFLQLGSDIGRRIRVYERFTHTVAAVDRIESKIVARVAPDQSSISSSDKLNLECRLACGHTTPLHYLQWWLEEQRTPDESPCPQCGKSFSYRIYADDMKKDQGNEDIRSHFSSISVCACCHPANI